MCIRDRIEAKRLATVEAEPHLIFVANLHLQKNHRLLVNAFAKVLKTYPNARLTIAGAFDSDHEIGRLVKGDIKKLKIGKQIDLAGLIDRKALSRLLSKAHIAVLPTLFEGFSIASLEYTYFGLPCVLSRTGAADYLADKYGHACVVAQAALAPDELSNDILETRALHDFNDAVEPLAAAIITILDDYETYSANAVKAAMASDEYSIETTAQAYIDIHEATMNKMGRVAK